MAANITDSIQFLESLINNPNTDLNSIIIELGSKEDRIERRMNENKVVFRVPKKYFETLRIKLQGEKAARKLRANAERKQRGAYIDEGAKDIDAIFKGKEREEAVNTYSNAKEPTTKRIIERKIRDINRAKEAAKEAKKAEKKTNKNKKRRIKNKPNKRVKALFGTLVLATGFIAGGIAMDRYVGEYHETEKSVEGLSVEEINELAENELLQAISEGTEVSIEDIKISERDIDSSTHDTQVTISQGEDVTTYNLAVNHRDPVSFGSMSGNITDIISSIRNANTKKEAINALMKERKFVKNNKVKNDNGKLTTETRPTETRSEGSQEMDEYTL